MNSKIKIKIKVIALVATIVLFGCVATCCTNKQIWDTTFSFEYAMVAMPNGTVVEGPVDSWTDFEDGDQIQVKIDGKTYLTHSTNVVLVSK